MYAGNTVSPANALSKSNSGLKVATNLKAGAAASNPSLLNPQQEVVGHLQLRTVVLAGLKPCNSYFLSI